ncbi:tetratricopeptide repeat (TPR)-like superfamily protein [Tasmannia lanceolata]|uniref:tetratricopeptide repeat (TPR)-like superfamily protein n=1 Tax=Tasmannia lanceolata TaxID=3420 RepID=UPI004064A51F
MCSFHRLFLGLFQTKRPSFLGLNNNVTTVVNAQTENSISQFRTNTTLPESNHSPPKFGHTLAEIITAHLQSCTNLIDLNQIHAQMIRTHLLETQPSPFHWNSLMRSYLRLALPSMVLPIYAQMSRTGISPDSYTIPIALKAACHIFAIDGGKQFHSIAIRHGLESNEYCESGLISMYSKAGEIESALKVFDQNHERKLGSWNAIIGGFAQGGHSKEAMDMFLELRKCGLKPNDVTMVSVASACGSLGDLNLALQVHKCVFQAKSLDKSDILMSNSLIDMYGKCGRMDLADKVFVGMEERNVSTWTSMIMGLAMHGHVNCALDLFCCMREAGVRPNHVTFVGVLSACVHGGLVEEGRYYFDAMVRVYGIVPMLPHYGCMVDLLGRAGMLEEAREMVMRMPMRVNSVIWGTLLGACEKHGNVEMGKWVAGNLIELEPWNDGVYVVLSNIYAGAELWDEVERVRGLMKEKRVAKTPSYSLATTSISPKW